MMIATLLLAASFFTADGPLEKSGWTESNHCDADKMYVKDGVLYCEFAPGKVNTGIGYQRTLPHYTRGILEYEIMPMESSSGQTSDFYMPIRIGTYYLFLQNGSMCRYCDSANPRYYGVGNHLFPGHQWVKVKIIWDNEREIVRYYVNDMEKPNRIEYGGKIGAGNGKLEPGEMEVLIYNYARAAVTARHLIKNFSVSEYVPPGKGKKFPRTKALVFRGLTSPYFPLDKWTEKFAECDIVKFNLDYTGRANFGHNCNSLNFLPDEESIAKAKLIILCDIPLKGAVLPYPVQEDILSAVNDGARLLITAGLAGLEKGEGFDSPIAKALPVKLESPWKLPKPKDGSQGDKAVCNYGKGKISVILKRTMTR